METENTPNLILQDYLEKAYAYYTKLNPRFETADLNGYWIRGCILDSMIDFLLQAGRENIVPYTKGAQWLNSTALVYLDNQSQGEWYDDWMWWGNATSKVFDPIYKDLFDVNPDLKKNFIEICSQTFNFVKSGKTPFYPMDHSGYVGTMNAFDYVKEQAAIDPARWRQFSKDVEPRWNIGCWQGPMTLDQGYDPRYVGLGPFQDSVVNGLFYIFAQRTLHSQKGLGTQQDINDMTTFYSNWNEPAIPANKSLFNRITPQAGLFRERVSVYMNGMGVNGFDPDLAWSGDQGLMLSALTNLYFTQSGSPKQQSLNTIRAIINGVVGYAIGNINQNHKNVIMPWCHINLPPFQQPGGAPGGDQGDYFSGTGVFMRGLLEASRIPEVKELIHSASVQTVLKNTLAALLDKDQNGNDTNIYMNFVFGNNPPPSYDPHEWFNDFNKMAALLVANQLIITIED